MSTTALMEGGVVFLEQHSFASEQHMLIELTSLAVIERLERFLSLAKKQVR